MRIKVRYPSGGGTVYSDPNSRVLPVAVEDADVAGNVFGTTAGNPKCEDGASASLVWRTICFSKGLVALAILVGAFVDFNTEQFRSAYARWPLTETPHLSSRLATWDAAHYLILSQDGYRDGSHSCAFYPLWPALIQVGSYFTFGSALASAWLLANGLSLAGLWFFYRVIKRGCGETVATKSLILLLAFPGAMFFTFPYTESLYLLLVMAFFWELEKERYFWPCALGFLMPLTKAIGVFIVLPWAWHLWQQRRPLKYWLLLGVPVLGYLAYFAVLWAYTGNPFAGFDAQKAYPYSPSIKNMFNVAAFTDAFLSFQSLNGMMDSALDRGFFILLLVSLPFIYRLNKKWFFYTVPLGMVPALTSYFMSYRRYLMICFPVFVLLAQLFHRGGNRWSFWYYVVLLGALQIWAVIRFVNFYWAG